MIAKQATLSLPGLRRYIDRSKTWIFSAMKESGFPRPIKMGGKNSNLWLVSEVDRWIEEQRERRDLSAPKVEGAAQSDTSDWLTDDPLFDERSPREAAQQLALVLAWAAECQLETVAYIKDKLRVSASSKSRNEYIAAKLVLSCKDLNVTPKESCPMLAEELKLSRDILLARLEKHHVWHPGRGLNAPITGGR